MTSLISCLHMHKHKVLLSQRIDGCLCLALVVCISQTRCAFHFDDIQTCIVSDASNQVNGRNHGTRLHLRVELLQGLHTWAVSPTPWPDAVGRTLTICHFFLIIRMGSKQVLGFQNEVVEQVGHFLTCHALMLAAIGIHIHVFLVFPTRFCRHEQRSPLFVWMVVRRIANHMFVSTLDD